MKFQIGKEGRAFLPRFDESNEYPEQSFIRHKEINATKLT